MIAPLREGGTNARGPRILAGKINRVVLVAQVVAFVGDGILILVLRSPPPRPPPPIEPGTFWGVLGSFLAVVAVLVYYVLLWDSTGTSKTPWSEHLGYICFSLILSRRDR